MRHISEKSGTRIASAISASVCVALASAAVRVAAANEPPTGPEPCQPHWDNTIGQPGMNWFVRSLGEFDDGSGPALYAGGSFTEAGGVKANNIAKWDGEQWLPVGSGIVSAGFAPVSAMAVFDDGSGPALYVGGALSAAGGVDASNIARWDGEQWSALGSGTNEPVRALAVFDDGFGPALYAGGTFTEAGGVPVGMVAKWDGREWSAINTSVFFPCFQDPEENCASVGALKVFDDGSGPALYMGGRFDTLDGQEFNQIARWDGEQWSALGDGLDGPPLFPSVLAMKAFDDGSGSALHVGGSFSFAGGNPAQRLAKWDGQDWSAVGPSDQTISGTPFTLDDFDDGSGPALYVAGQMTWVGDLIAHNIARWDGEQWSALDGGVGPFGGIPCPMIEVVKLFDDGAGGGPSLYVGGRFSLAGGLPSNFIAQWKGCPEPPAIPGDLTGDGSVGVDDLLILLADWGACPDPDDCPADLTGDDSVGVDDLLTLLANWG